MGSLRDEQRAMRREVDEVHQTVLGFNATIAHLEGGQQANTATIKVIEQRTEPLADIAAGVKALHLVARGVMWIGGLAGAVAAFLVLLEKI